MQFKQELLVFPTSRSIRSYIQNKKDKNLLLPFTITIDELFKKSIVLENRKLIDEEERFLFLKEAILHTNLKKLGISNEFTKFLKQYNYIYRFFLELASEKKEIDELILADTYEFYSEHLDILKQIHKNYIEILDKNLAVDKLNFNSHYKINKDFFLRFKKVHLYFEGYFTKQEFDIIYEISKEINLSISFYSYSYNKKSIETFQDFFDFEFKENFFYKIDLSNKKILIEEAIESKNKNIQVKAFASRINQISYIKHSITTFIDKGYNPSSIALVLPDEKFASTVSLFDNERYFNYAMGKDIKQTPLYQISYAISNYINEDDVKFIKNIEYLNIDKNFIDTFIKDIWNQNCNTDNFDKLISFIKSYEMNNELLEKFDEVIYKLKILIFSTNSYLKIKEVYKIFLQKVSAITLDDINSGKITVMGLLETRLSSYDAVIICDFNESYIPKTSVKDKFLSSKLKELAKLPTSMDRQNLQKYYYKRLINSSKEVNVCFVHSSTNTLSRFANELFKVKIDEKLEDNYYKHILYNNHQIKYLDDDIKDKINLDKLEWSATSLKTFLQCKKKFYLQYILKIKDHDISLKPKAFELGDTIHKILEEYYTINDQKDELSFSKIERLFAKYKSTNAFLILDLEIWKNKLKEFYEYENHRMQNRQVIECEKKFYIDFHGIKLKGIIDRIDKHNEDFEVIDYKTSSTLKVDTAKNYEKSNDFQLEFYYLAVRELFKTENIKSFYYDLHNTKLLEETTLEQKLLLLEDKFLEIKELSKNELIFSKCEEKATCAFCNYKTICNR